MLRFQCGVADRDELWITVTSELRLIGLRQDCHVVYSDGCAALWPCDQDLQGDREPANDRHPGNALDEILCRTL